MGVIKAFSPAALAMAAAMVFLGVFPVMADSTALCTAHEEPCTKGNVITAIHMALTSGTVWLLSTSEVDLLCLGVLGQASVGEPGDPQGIELTELNYTGCGTEGSGGGHSNCTVTSNATKEEPNYYLGLFKTALNLGELEALNIETKVKCTVFGFVTINCEYGGAGNFFHFEGAEGKGNGMLSMESTPLELLTGGSLCPESAEISSALLEPLEKTYITGTEFEGEIDASVALEPAAGLVFHPNDTKTSHD